jgi:hypothetical protein
MKSWPSLSFDINLFSNIIYVLYSRHDFLLFVDSRVAIPPPPSSEKSFKFLFFFEMTFGNFSSQQRRVVLLSRSLLNSTIRSFLVCLFLCLSLQVSDSLYVFLPMCMFVSASLTPSFSVSIPSLSKNRHKHRHFHKS